MSHANFEPGSPFSKHPVMAEAVSATCDPEAEQMALRYMNKYAPDLLGMVLGHVL